MKDFETIKKIGYKQAFKGVTAGLVIGYVIMALLAGPFWLFQVDYAPEIFFAIIMIYVSGYVFGGFTSILISKYKQRALLFGIIGGFLIVWVATFLGSLIGFVSEGLQSQSEVVEAANDYICKPMALVTIFGTLPIILIGVWFGLSIKKKLSFLEMW